MKLIHLSDLHIGKRVNEFSMLEDQADILLKILNIIDDEKPDGIIIAGDIYDKSIPSTEAVELFDDFLVKLAQRNLQVFAISGNHDSPERIAFGNRLMDASGIHISPVYDGRITPVKMQDKYGTVNIYMLPFVKPANVRRFFEEEQIESYTDAVRIAINQMNVDHSVRNVLVTHQFVTGATRSESEEISVGGADNVDASAFDGFDYVALGHIHGPQNIGSEKIRYCGSPLKYSFSEVDHRKSVTVVELLEKGNISFKYVPLIPKHDMVKLRGSYEDLTLKSFYVNTSYTTDYVHITLTDEEDVVNAINKLRVIYANLMKLDYDNTRTRTTRTLGSASVDKTPIELFSEFYEKQNNKPMTAEQTDYVNKMIEIVWEDEV